MGTANSFSFVFLVWVPQPGRVRAWPMNRLKVGKGRYAGRGYVNTVCPNEGWTKQRRILGKGASGSDEGADEDEGGVG
jgi:hypothetical protein